MSCMDFEPPKALCCIGQKNLEQKVIQHYMNKHNEKLTQILESELQYLGIKPPLTQGKMKWHGINLFIDNHLDCIKYKLVQRGNLINSFTIFHE